MADPVNDPATDDNGGKRSMTTPGTNTIGWFEIYVRDMVRARRFYEGVFGRALQPLGPPEVGMWSFPSQLGQYGCGGALVSHPEMPAGGNSTVVYFFCADCAVEESRVPDFGGTVVRPKMSIGPFGFVSLVKDPEGNLIGLLTPLMPEGHDT